MIDSVCEDVECPAACGWGRTAQICACAN